MSEIRVTTLSDTAGSNASTASEIFEGRCKAWLQLDANNSSLSIENDYNVNSVSYTAAGKYVVNFSNALSGSTYCVVASAGRASGNAYDGICWPNVQSRSTSNMTVWTTYTNNNFSAAANLDDLTPIWGVVVFD